PLPSPMINSATIVSLNIKSFAPTYYLGYALANGHILQTVLLVGALYLGFAKKPWLSALLFAFGVFDPRAALLALPLLLWYNRQKIIQFSAATATFLLATNLPFFFYYGIGMAFLRTEVNGNIVSQMYQYDWIPLYAVAALTIVEIVTFIYGKRKKPSEFSGVTGSLG
ncbi:MAG TPA: hypothetical protein VEF91_07675, partial [Verrucomicrobiae bacterium]|nr:hypothetical protein [Verrucomicrobiae bacterium]